MLSTLLTSLKDASKVDHYKQLAPESPYWSNCKEWGCELVIASAR